MKAHATLIGAIGLAVMGWPAALAAQVMPQPGLDNPRIQTVRYTPQQDVALTLLPATPLTVMLRPGDMITDVTPGGTGFRVQVSSERDAFTVVPSGGVPSGSLDVATQDRRYRFTLSVGEGLAAALLVRFVEDEPSATQYASAAPPIPSEPVAIWNYRIRGDREVRPFGIVDDGSATRIIYHPDQALPAVFAIGPTGEEEVVNGYMRDGFFVLDRVYEELVFRIDREKATARRNREPEEMR